FDWVRRPKVALHPLPNRTQEELVEDLLSVPELAIKLDTSERPELERRAAELDKSIEPYYRGPFLPPGQEFVLKGLSLAPHGEALLDEVNAQSFVESVLELRKCLFQARPSAKPERPLEVEKLRDCLAKFPVRDGAARACLQ